MKYKSIKIMPDFCSSGIWDNKSGIMIEFEDLAISKKLKKDFENWIQYYDDKCTSKKTYCVLKSKEQILNNKGRELAHKLKKEHINLEVWYLPEYNGYIGEPEKIE